MVEPPGIAAMTRAAAFKRTDVTRAARAVLDAGLNVARIEINKDGVIVVVPSKPEELASSEAASSEWDIA
jgi:hypothetical protein